MSEIERRSKLLQSKMTLENLYQIINSKPDLIAARYLENDIEQTITYKQYNERVQACAALIRAKLGDAKDGSQFIAIQVDTCPEYYIYYWGITLAGYNALLLDAHLNDEMTVYMLGQAGASAVIGLKKRALPANYVQLDAKELAAAPAVKNYKPVYGTMVALCTSGTTATSRIYVYNERAISYQVLNSELLRHANARFITDEPRRHLAFLPFHHIFGFMVCLMWMSFICYEQIYLHDRAPQTIQKTAQRFHVTHLMTVPLLANNLSIGLNKKIAKEGKIKRAVYHSMRGTSLALQSVAPGFGIDFSRKYMFKKINAQLLGSDIRCIIVGGSHVPAKYIRTLSALGYYVVCGFGMTETGITSVEVSNNVLKRSSGSVGRPLESVEYRVNPTAADPNVGEMYIRGESLHTGRLIDGKLMPPDLDEQGWYRTGDVVTLKKGNRMYVEGRAKDVIINESGENVYPDEVEEAFTALDGPDQFCVLGIAAETGKKKTSKYETITLAMNIGAHYGDQAFIANLMSQVRKMNADLPAIKRVNRVLVSPDAFELSGSMKIKRQALKKEIENGTLVYRDVDFLHAGETLAESKPQEAAPVKTANTAEIKELKEKLRKIYAETLDVPAETIRDDAHFIDELGGDSLQVLGMSLKLEEQMGVLIPPEEYGQCTTINDLSALVMSHLNGDEHAEESAPVTPITRFEDAPEFKAFAARQAALITSEEDNPYFVCHESPLTDKSFTDGEWKLNFGSYNYVGMSGRKETKEAAKAAIDKYGTSASGSRLLAGEKKLYQELEREIADWKHAEDALVLVGGHSTNVTFVGNFCGKGDLILYDAIAHNSIAQGCQLSKAVSRPFPHNDLEKLEGILKAQRDKYGKVLIVIEGAYSMDGDIAPVPEVVALKKKYGCFLMVDEAHSACVIGKTGGGVDEYFGLAGDDIDIKMGTLSKGLGACGGYLAGSHNLIEYLRYNVPGFVFSVGISPALAAEVLCAIRLLRSDPTIMANMRRNITCFVEEAHKRNFNTCLAGDTAIIPILVGKDEDAFLLSNLMRKKGVIVPPAVPPAVPKGKARLRFCVTSDHTPEEIVEALDKLVECAAEAGITLPS